jgi:hypothetical protein
MPKKTYALEKNGPKEIEISWGFAWKDFTVRQNGEIIGTVSSQSELKAGKQFKLKDGSDLQVKLNVGLAKAGLEVLHDNQFLPGSDLDPVKQVNTAFGLLLFIGGLNILVGILLTAFRIPILGEIAGIGIIAFGLIFTGLAFAVKSRSLVALYIAIALLIIDAVSTIAIQAEVGRSSTGWIILRVFFLIYLFRAIKPLKELRNKVS